MLNSPTLPPDQPLEQENWECPQCKTMIPVYRGYTRWCDQCGWGLTLQEAKQPQTRLESLYLSLNKQHGKKLLLEMMQSASFKPELNLSKVLAFSLALVIHGLSVVFAILGGILLLRGWPNPVILFGGVVCLLIAWMLFPRFSKLPKDISTRDDFPTLHKVVDEIAQILDTPTVDGIVINSHYNAAFGQMGWQRKRILFLGLPLFWVLNEQERAALIAHELAHGVNGDPTRGFFIGSAYSSLISWYRILAPTELITPGNGIFTLLSIPVNLLLLLISQIVWYGSLLFLHLVWQDSQRAEYLADYLAARLGGTDAMLSTLAKLHLGDTVWQIVQSISTNRDKHNVFDELKDHVQNIPHREFERIKRVNQLEVEISRLETTHPPTAYRTEFLAAHPVDEPKFQLSPTDMTSLQEELKPLQEKIQSRLIDLYRQSLYY